MDQWKEDPDRPKQQATWTQPAAAYARYQPGLSPYLHYWQALRVRRGEVPPPPELGPEEGNSLPEQMKGSLEEMILRSFGR